MRHDKQQGQMYQGDILPYASFQKLRLLSLSIIVLLVFGAGVTVYYLYASVFETIANVHSLLLRSDELGSDVLDFSTYDTVKQAWEKKQTIHATTTLRNVFLTSSSSAAVLPVPVVVPIIPTVKSSASTSL